MSNEYVKYGSHLKEFSKSITVIYKVQNIDM